MSYAIPYEDQQLYPAETAPVAQELIFVPRSRMQWIPFVLPLVMCAASWVGGGIPLLTDFAFIFFAGTCAVFLFMEFVRFPRRFGIGGMVLFGGVLIWFCHDYFSNWFLRDFTDPLATLQPWVIAKSATLHVLFVIMMIFGLNLMVGRWAERVVLSVPNPVDESFYFIVILGMFAIGISPFFFATSEPFYMAMFHAMTAGWTRSTAWTVFRSGNLNYSWGAYVAQVLQIGAVGGILAIVYAIIITRRWSLWCIAMAIWGFWLAMAFQTDRRGEVAYMALPPLALVFIKYQARAAAMFQRFSLRAYLVGGILGFILLFVVQYLGTFRGVGMAAGEFSKVSLIKNQGNTMFSEGLPGFQMIPEHRHYFRANFPGAGLIRPIPDSIWWFVVGAVPRALWHDKPVDPLWEWYNKLITGNESGRVGTTISHGLVGNWYFNYGLWGVLEGGLLCGWLMGVAERSLQHSNGRPIGIMMSLGLATWLFRTFRDFLFIDLYPLIIGAVAFSVLVVLFRPFLRRSPNPQPG